MIHLVPVLSLAAWLPVAAAATLASTPDLGKA
jgi:hypothetical protein